ncbi:phosphotransferase family protein [Brevibacterium spongiae]|uniref:Phosphotransferase family protein n=1 Tax=Brevibacterium spongiae TaxID=2909672 RepID=A0ABY5ST59_9MICO|nr:phosphotransferase family protein [Brevibacterium spongiae]UVI37325.1 phosphotransferase family protein [Brevibacterium spongiae]
MTQAPAGFDAHSIGRWIEQRFGISDFGVEVMSVGRSNLTFTITVDGSPRWVLRRPPLGHEGGSAHNVAREGRIMAALSGSGVPVPNVLEIVDDPEVLDVPFVFMDHCPGLPIHTPTDWESIPAENRRDCAFGMVDALAAIHAVDVDAVGLSDLRRPGGLIERQLRRWIGQVEQISMRETPMIHEVHDVLAQAMPDPAGSPVGIAHGDFKPNNMIFAPDGTVNAVVDWELTAVGEVLTDLGYFIAMLTVPEEFTSIWVPRPEDGFPTSAELIDRYQAVSGHEVHDVDYYSAFAMWKLACIREGVYTRLATGKMGDLDLDPEAAGEGVEDLARQALELLEKP